MPKKVAIIGSGFAGLAAACVVARAGHLVTVFEKNDCIGGRARTLRSAGYVFDMGPSWYWMPDVFERFFALFGKNVEDYYKLVQLDPGFSIFFGKDDCMDVPASVDAIYMLFERMEDGGAVRLQKFLAEARTKYDIAFGDFIYKPSSSITEFLNYRTLSNMLNLDLFRSFSSHVRKYFSNERLISLMEFPILFLGGSSENIPSLYSLMNYAALGQGTWYPLGGFSNVSAAIATLAADLNVKIRTGETIREISIDKDLVKWVVTDKERHEFNAAVASCDYVHTEQLIEPRFRNYSDNYWDKKVMSPSSLIFFIGVNKKVKGLRHHNLFFDKDFKTHADEIYKHPSWPTDPLFYVCCPSKTDPVVAPIGHENLFILMPLAAGLPDNEAIRERYFGILMRRLEHILGESIEPYIDYSKSYCISNFMQDYNAYKGNAYGLANTLSQTAILKPALRNKKVKNLFYAGQLTVPGPGVPPALISGQIAAEQLLKSFKN